MQDAQIQEEIPGSPTSRALPFTLHYQCGPLRKAVRPGEPGPINRRPTCHQQMGGVHAQWEKDTAFINHSFSFKRFIIFAKTFGSTNRLCLWAAGDGPRPDSSKEWGAQLLVFSSCLSHSQSQAKRSAGCQLAAFVMLQGKWKRGQGCEFSPLMSGCAPERENNVPRLKSPALTRTKELSAMYDLSPGRGHRGTWRLSLSWSPPRS